MNKSFMFLGIFAALAVMGLGMGVALADVPRVEERHGVYSPSSSQFFITCGSEFESIDVDGDGYLSRMEYETAYKGPGARGTIPSTTGMNASLAFGRKDFNNDWMLSSEEFCS